MSTREMGAPSPPIESYDDLVGWFETGCKPRDDWRIGTEHEKFVFHTDDLSPVPYEGPRGIRAILQSMIDQFGWLPIMEGDNIIGLKRGPGEPGGNISLEPGGQFELSGAPVRTLHQTCTEASVHLSEVKAVSRELGIGFLGLGFSPMWPLAAIPQMPKQRYGVMTRYMPKVGTRGLDMMYRTCTIQVNLDFASEADMVRKLRVSLALQPIATALFASSPFADGKPNGALSMRSEVWRDVDNQRAGMLPFVFEDGMGFSAYVDYALDVPMYFVFREGNSIDVTGQSFRTFLEGKLPQLPGEKPSLDDWSDHLTTIFPEVRMKRFLEMRGADGGPWERICGLPAFWVGLLYDDEALQAASDLIAPWTQEQRQQLRDDVPTQGFEARLGNRTVRDIARECLALSRAGLDRRGFLSNTGQLESMHLDALDQMVETGETSADEMLRLYRGRWAGDITNVFKDYAF